MSIDCCKNCVPPKRHIGCHGTCKEYIKQKKKHEKDREEITNQKIKEEVVSKYYSKRKQKKLKRVIAIKRNKR